MICKSHLSRRGFLKGALILPPVFNFPNVSQGAGPSILRNLILRNGFENITSAALYDLRTNAVIEEYNGNLKLPPASVAKAVTAVYALETVGKSYRFQTELRLNGQINKNGVLEGDIYLIGGGDPSLNIDNLGNFVEALKLAGIKTISGRFFFDDSWFPNLLEIDPLQMPQESFNPGLSGLNLNSNRVLFSWKKNGTDFDLKIFSGGKNYNVNLQGISITASDELHSSYEYEIDRSRGSEHWRVSSQVLNKKGVRWLPVRLSSYFTCEVLKTLCKKSGISLPNPEPTNRQSNNFSLVHMHNSDTLNELSRVMLWKSTNILAEIIGLNTAKLWDLNSRSIRESGKIMTKWFNYVTNSNGSKFENHSGLTTRSRVSGRDFVNFLKRRETVHFLMPILKEKKIFGQKSKRFRSSKIDVVAKTGTMHFIRSLGGYIRKDGKPLAAFVIFSADLNKKTKKIKSNFESPPGSKAWLGRAKSQENKILTHWADIFT